jgi:hypothetical protein
MKRFAILLLCASSAFGQGTNVAGNPGNQHGAAPIEDVPEPEVYPGRRWRARLSGPFEGGCPVL